MSIQSLPLILFWVRGTLEPIPAVTGREAGSTRDRSQGQHTDTDNHNLQILPHMSARLEQTDDGNSEQVILPPQARSSGFPQNHL